MPPSPLLSASSFLAFRDFGHYSAPYGDFAISGMFDFSRDDDGLAPTLRTIDDKRCCRFGFTVA